MTHTRVRVGRVGKFHIFHATFWFPDLKMRSGDFAMLFTKAGQNSVLENVRDSKTYKLHWGRTEPAWTEPTDIPVLMYIADWEPYRGEKEPSA